MQELFQEYYDFVISKFHEPSSVDWCETNYSISQLLAEFWNTWSSLSMVVLGLVGLWKHGHMGKRFILLWFFFMVVGFGSVAFHATLLFPFQLLDELPMLWTSAVLLSLFIERLEQPRYGWKVRGVITLWALTATLLTLQNGKLQATFFQGSFIINNVGCIVYAERFVNKETRNKKAKLVWWVGKRVYMLAGMLWLIDLKLCDLIQTVWPLNPQFHAWWHLFAGIGCYTICLLGVLACMEARKHKADIEMVLGVIPYVKVLKYHNSSAKSTKSTKKNQ